MADTLDGVRDHYRLVERLKAALATFGPEDQMLTFQQLAVLDQFHTRVLAATADLASLAGTPAGMSVLDVGSGVGAPARLVAATAHARRHARRDRTRLLQDAHMARRYRRCQGLGCRNCVRPA